MSERNGDTTEDPRTLTVCRRDASNAIFWLALSMVLGDHGKHVKAYSERYNAGRRTAQTSILESDAYVSIKRQ